MRLELAERLRCPSAHAPTPLIVVAQRTVGRELAAALLGCPVCRLEARIADGDVWFDGPIGLSRAAAAPADLERVVALLGLAEPGGAVLLTGRYGTLAQPLAELADVSVVLMHGEVAHESPDDPISVVHGSPAVVPFTDGTFRGAALDSGLPSAFVADAVRATAVGGRVLADAAVALPSGVKELARDDTEWVAAREAGGTIVELKRRG